MQGRRGPAGRLVAVAAVLAAGAATAEGADPRPLEFRTWTSRPLDAVERSSVYGMVLADVDGDGNRDVVTAQWGPHRLVVIRGRGGRDHHPAEVSPLDFPLGYRLVASDFDGDGDPDLAGVNLDDPGSGSAAREAVVLRNDGGTFSVAERLRVNSVSNYIATGDLDGDGDDDLVVSGPTISYATIVWNGDGGRFSLGPKLQTLLRLGTVWLFDVNEDSIADMVAEGRDEADGAWKLVLRLGLGGGDFSPPTLLEGIPSPGSVAFGDVDRDGNPDIVAGSGNGFAVLLGDGAGGFPAVRLRQDADYLSPVSLGDLDGDGWLDVQGRNGIIYYGAGEGLFESPVLYSHGSRGGVYAVEDLDGDGLSDIAIAQGLSSVGARVVFLYGRTDSTLEAPRSYATTDRLSARDRWKPVAMRGGDFDRDGHLDLAVANQKSAGGPEDEIIILRGDGRGEFQPFRRNVIPDLGQYHMIVSDLDGDGLPDLASCGTAFQGGVAVLFGLGDGTFSEASVYRTPWIAQFPLRMVAADLDRDGDRELVAASKQAGKLIVLPHEEGRRFGDPLVIPESNDERLSNARSLAVCDLDRDGGDDVVFIHSRKVPPVYPVDVQVLRKDGHGALEVHRAYRFERAGGSIAAGDVTGDGLADVVVTLEPEVAVERGGSWQLAVLQGQGDGTLREWTRVTLPTSRGDQTARIDLQDVDGDGDLDYVGTGNDYWTTDRVTILLNRGDGLVEGMVRPECERDVRSAVFGDFDGDGDTDLAALNSDTARITVLLNEAAGGAPGDEARFRRGDVDATGSIELTDAIGILLYLFLRGPPPSCQKSADADDDGAVSIADAVYLLDHLFRGGDGPPAPGSVCGKDPTEDALGCRLHPPCPSAP